MPSVFSAWKFFATLFTLPFLVALIIDGVIGAALSKG